MPALCRYVGLLTLASVSAFAQSSARRNEKPVWPDEGPMTWAPRPTVAEITANDLRTRLYQFADDSMLGRKIGEIGNVKGTDYIAREFKRFGLKPGGENGTYFQTLPYGPGHYDSATAQLIIGGATLKPKVDWIPTAAATGSRIGGTAALTSVPTVFLGRWGDTATVLDPAMVRGKIAVFVSANAGGGRGGRGGQQMARCDSLPDQFGAEAIIAAAASGRSRGLGNRTPSDPRAQRAGALGVIVVGLEGTPRNLISGAFTPKMGMRPSPTSPMIPAATISAVGAAALFNHSIEEISVGQEGQPVTMNWRFDWMMAQYPARNVIAVLPGSDPTRAAEYVLVGAHNDHIGVSDSAVEHDSLRAYNITVRKQGNNGSVPACRPTADQQHEIDSLIQRARSIRPARRDSINNGADDDGSGTVILLEIAEKFARERPARSIIFISHVGEEAGLLGSQYFTEHPTIPLTSIVAAHNMDMEGHGRASEAMHGGPNSLQILGARRLSREFGDIIDSVSAARPVPMALDKSWDVPANPLNRFCRSDQVNYVNHDVPVTYFSTGYAPDYHEPTDEPQYIDYEHMARIGGFIHDVMMAIADRKDRLAITGADPTMPKCAR